MAGFIYVLSNPLFARIKIGKSSKDPTRDRLDELNRETGTPEKYKCEYYAFVGDEHGLELNVHRQFSHRRPNPKREFFDISISEAINAIRDLAHDHGGIKYEEIYFQDLQTIKYENGHVYEGEIKNGLRHGYGKYTWPSGQQYVGGYMDGKQHGYGTRTWPSGQQYVGDYKYDKQNGHGTFTWADGERHVGDWKDGVECGHGERTWPSGQKYVGDWKDGKRSGYGTQTLPDGQRYVGEWWNGERHGLGKETLPDGQQYEGEWRYDERRQDLPRASNLKFKKNKTGNSIKGWTWSLIMVLIFLGIVGWNN